MRSRWSESWSHYDSHDILKDEVVIPDVRLKSAAGWYIGALEFYSFDEIDFYSRDTEYYPSDMMLYENYPNSISVEEAINKVNNHPLYRRKMERKLGKIK